MNSEKYKAGMAVRREVLGDEHVDRAIAGATDFTKPLQDMVTENCWGEIWTRGVLTRQTRSLITIATLAALKAPTELKGHVLGVLRQRLYGGRNPGSSASVHSLLRGPVRHRGFQGGKRGY